MRIIDPVIDFKKPAREILGDEPSDGGEMKEHKLTQGNEAFVTQESIVEQKSDMLYLRA